MIILSLDTTSRSGSAAVLREGAVVAERVGDSSITHGQRLPADLMRLLEAAGLSIEDVELFAVAVGPGSFTGLRIGIATVQGLALARAKQVVPVSTLDALARAVPAGFPVIGAWMDAQRGEVFAAAYDGHCHEALTDAVVLPPDEVLGRWHAVTGLDGGVFTGDGAVRYAGVIRSTLGSRALIQPPPPLAATIARLAAAAPSRAVAPHALVPLYVRRPDAELARARRGEAAPPSERQ